MNNYFKNIFQQKNKLILIFVFLIYLAITLFASLKHQPWRDEAQSWLIARDLSPLGIIRQMPYEGTPPLWHLINYPFAASGAPYSIEFIINYLFAAAAIFLLLFFSPLPKPVKILLPLSYYFLFEYSVIARNYSLIILSLFAVASFYQWRFKRPLLYAASIALLAWSGIQTFATAALLTLFFIIEALQNKHEERRYLAAIIIMLLFLLSVILILLPYPDQLYDNLKFNGLNYLARAVSVSLLPYFFDVFIPPIYPWIISILWLALIPFIIKTRTARLIILGSFLWMMFIIAFKNFGYLRHYGLFLIMFVFAWWLDIYYRTKKEKRGSLSRFIALTFFLVCLAGNAAYSAYYYYDTRETNYSGAKEMANYLIKNNLVNEEIATYPTIAGSALLPFLPGKKFFQMELGEMGTYVSWDDKYKYATLLPYWEHRKNTWLFYKSTNPHLKSVLILSTWPLKQYDVSLIPIYQNTKPSLTDEYFYLYRLPLP